MIPPRTLVKLTVWLRRGNAVFPAVLAELIELVMVAA